MDSQLFNACTHTDTLNNLEEGLHGMRLLQKLNMRFGMCSSLLHGLVVNQQVKLTWIWIPALHACRYIGDINFAYSLLNHIIWESG